MYKTDSATTTAQNWDSLLMYILLLKNPNFLNLI